MTAIFTGAASGIILYLLLSHIERRSYYDGYEDAMNDHRPRFRRRAGFTHPQTKESTQKQN